MAISKLAEFVRSAEGEGTLKDLVALGLVKCAHREKLCALVDGTCQSMDNKGRCLQKQSSLTEKTANIGVMVGANRAAGLSDEEKAALIKHYGLSDDASLAIRNSIRGAIGSGVGQVLGGTAGYAAGKVLKGRPLIGAMIGTPIGGMLGMKLMTDRYSQGNARDIMRRNRG